MKYMVYFLLLSFLFVVGCAEEVQMPVTTTTTSEIQVTTTSTLQDISSNLQTTTTQAVTTTQAGVSLQELSLHSSLNDCWVSYEGSVYDITGYVPKHPGSAAAIVPYCGTSDDFSRAFTNQHGTSKVGVLVQQGMYMGDLQ